ncbi:MAG: pantoate--beta-alanine ligase [Verrucomicrobia bacterium]|nr:pantoate--beta-alanine ligase [Verrucomicrobiota bacterium]
MKSFKSPKGLQRWSLEMRTQGTPVALVPTMGFLHQGHISLMRRARRAVGKSGKVVVSIYVNPSQFGKGEDFTTYPRNLTRDLQLCGQEKVDAVFIPDNAAMYPGDYSTFVLEEDVSSSLEAVTRPTHFRGVTTIVCQLFNIAQPEVAIFGEKDFQQAITIKRMVRDLHLPVRILIAPTCREQDGLAMSSRNAYLSPNQRQQATVLYQMILRARELVNQGKPSSWNPVRLQKALEPMLLETPGVRLDYLPFVDSEHLRPMQRVTRGCRMLLAAYLGSTRLIDNARL